MNCPVCGNKMKKGTVEVIDGRLVSATALGWYPDEEKTKFIRKNAISLSLKGEGYYCDECMKVFAVFDER